MMRVVRNMALVIALLGFGPALVADRIARLDPSALAQGYVAVVAEWRFSADDRVEGQMPGLDDSSWTVTSTTLDAGNLPDGWDGSGWFRARFFVPHDGPYVLRSSQRGASAIWIDGVKAAQFGNVSGDEWHSRATGRAIVTLRGGKEHRIAVRYSNRDVTDYHRVGTFGGFRLSFALAEVGLASDLSAARASSGYLWFFTGIFAAFATIHILLWAYAPEIRENLFFALLCLSLAVLAFFLFYRDQMGDPALLLIAERAMNLAGLAMGLCLLRYVYGIFLDEAPLLLRLYAAVALGVAVWSAPDAAAAMTWVFVLMLIAMAEASRVVVRAIWRRTPGARLVGGGILAVALGFGIGLLAHLGALPSTKMTATLIPLGSVVILLALMSFYISRQFALTNQQLREKLVEVQVLSEQRIESERRMQREQVERTLLQAEYERKVHELEEARELQISMLPSRLPDVPGLELAARMDTATEVGGDYYDFELGDDGTLTIAVGDATGHGMRAGTMVTAAKTLFSVFGRQNDLPDVMGRSTRALKRMNLRRLSMALTLAQYRDGELRLSAGGMPPVFVWRAKTATVEQIEIHGMPLGAATRFPYTEASVRLGPGDAVLFMTDGFPERLSLRDELLGYDRALDAFRDAASSSASQIIEMLRGSAEHWAQGRPADDDVTFVVLKMLEASRG